MEIGLMFRAALISAFVFAVGTMMSQAHAVIADL